MKYIILSSFLLLSTIISAQSIERYAIPSIGSVQANGNFSIHQTIGEPISGVLDNNDFLVIQGFQQVFEGLTSVKNLAAGYATTLFPNPSNGNISLKGDFEFEAFSIFDTNGKLLKSGKWTKDNALETHLPPGTYYLNVKTKENYPINLPFIIQ
ncbi:MAG: T9SS type A sorting domain-containing protein [Saprospiraceae bacterium]|nr:T9SS type A sorting domain-containing protein [Saprospiraceae bacterium]